MKMVKQALGKPDVSAKISLRDTLQNMSVGHLVIETERIRNGFREGKTDLEKESWVECGGWWAEGSGHAPLNLARWAFKKCLLHKCAEK